MEFWLKFMEKYGMPWAIGKYDRSMSEAEQKQLFTMLKRMVQDAVATIPADGSVELLSASDRGSSSEVFQNFITKCENNISKVLLGQTLTTDVGNVGSYAAASVHQNVREDLILNDVRLVENTVNELIKKINSLNFSETTLPYFELYDEEQIDQSTAERDNKVQSLGVKFTKEYIKKAYGYEDEDFEMVQTNDEGSDFSDKNEDNFGDEIDRFINDFTAQDYEKMIDKSIKPIIELFEQSRDAEECMERLAEIYPQMNNEELEKTLTKVIFLAELLGQIK